MTHMDALFDAPGPKGRARLAVINVIAFALIAGIFIWVVWSLVAKGELAPAAWAPFADPEVWTEYLIPGLLATLQAAAIAIVTSNILGLALGLGRLSALGPVRWVCGIIVEFFRAVPVLVMMIFFYFSLSYLANTTGAIDAEQAPFIGVVLGLTLYNGTVIAELVRSGVHNLPKGQREAGLAVGFTRGQCLRFIELPQALVAMMPAMVSQLVVILKDTALGYIVVYPELLRQAKLVGTSQGNLMASLLVAAALFITVNTLLGLVADQLSRRLSRRTSTTSDADPVDPAVLVEGD